MAGKAHGVDRLPIIALLGAAVVAVPLFHRLRLCSRIDCRTCIAVPVRYGFT